MNLKVAKSASFSSLAAFLHNFHVVAKDTQSIKVARNPVLSRLTTLEFKLIDFFVLFNRSLSVKLGIFGWHCHPIISL